MAHGDDDGLVLPPKIAPIKLVILPVLGKDDDKVLKFANDLKARLSNGQSNFTGSVEMWGDSGKFTGKTIGWKLSQSELMGIPLEITIGLKEIEQNGVVVCYRKNKNLVTGESDTEFANVPVNLKSDDILATVEKMLEHLQNVLLGRHKKFTETNTHSVDSYEEFKKVMAGPKGFISAFWCERAECELKIKNETKASTRCLPLDAKEEKGECVGCGGEAKYRWIFAQSY